jgi:hypothetical protein
MFKTRQTNIPQIKAVINEYGQCWFHGCGNIYVDKKESDFRKEFTNPNSEESVYRIHFTSISQVPSTVEDLDKLLLASRNKEMIEEKRPKSVTGVKTISVPTEETFVNDEDAELQRLIEEEQRQKVNQ